MESLLLKNLHYNFNTSDTVNIYIYFTKYKINIIEIYYLYVLRPELVKINLCGKAENTHIRFCYSESL